MLSKVFRLVIRWDLNQSNKCTDRHVSKKNNVNTSGNKKKDADPTKEVSKSNPIDMLNSVENDVDLGTNDGTLHRASKKANSRGSSLWNVESSNNKGETLEKGNSSGDHDSEDEVKSVDNEMTSFLASKKVSYGTNNLPEQWNETYENDDYDYDNIPDKIQSICNNLDIKV
ncbi:hypothetical protein Tco_1259007 [Tanacetum coccineum]